MASSICAVLKFLPQLVFIYMENQFQREVAPLFPAVQGCINQNTAVGRLADTSILFEYASWKLLWE